MGCIKTAEDGELFIFEVNDEKMTMMTIHHLTQKRQM